MSNSAIHAKLGIARGDYLLVTLHRPSLVDGPLFAPVMDGLAELARRLPVVFPMHPRARGRLSEQTQRTPGLHLVDPVGYVDFLALGTFAAGVLTDSGGVQEETTFLGVPCFTLRENTERPVTITHGTNRLLGLRPETLASIPQWLGTPPLNVRMPAGWDGKASARVADVLVRELTARMLAPPPEAGRPAVGALQ